MDYAALVQRSWRLTLHNRFLWILGLFATSSVGSCSPASPGTGFQWQTDSLEMERFFSPDLARAFQQADPLLSRNIGWVLLALALLFAVVALVFLVVSFFAQGGMADATADLAMGRPATWASAWNSGRRLFGRYLLLWLLLIGLGILVALAVAVLIGVMVAIWVGNEGLTRVTIAVLGGVLGLAALVIGVPLLAAISVVVAFAQRAIALENVGPWRALAIGAGLARRHLGTSAVAWLVSLALSIVVGIVVALAAAVLLAPLGGVAVGLFYATGSIISTALVLYVVLAVLVLAAALWLVGGIANAFFWSYWTLVYLNLTGRLTAQLEPPS